MKAMHAAVKSLYAEFCKLEPSSCVNIRSQGPGLVDNFAHVVGLGF